MKIYLMRHAQTDDNLVKRYSGNNDKVGINEQGKYQINNLLPILKSKNIKAVFSSPYRRCLETSLIINKFLKIDLFIDEKLKELNYGEWQGLTSNEVKEKYPIVYARRGRHPATTPPPEGETLSEMQKRVNQIINEIINSKKNSLIVTHGSCIHVILMYYKGIDLDKFWKFSQTYKLQNCSLWEIDKTFNKIRIKNIDINL